MNNRYRIYLLYVHCTVYVQFLYTEQHKLSRVYIQSFFCVTKLQSARLSIQSSELGPPNPLTHWRVLLPSPLLWAQGGSFSLVGEGGPNSDEGTATLVVYVYYNNPSMLHCKKSKK